MNNWYLWYDPQPLPGSWNMAVDEFLFRQVQESKVTYLRFYTWLKPTASLGCSQEVIRAVNFEECQRRGVDVVRRMTGGKMVLHHLEVTYSLSSSQTDIFTTTLEGSYRLISEALIKGLEIMGLKATLASTTVAGYARSNLPCFVYPARNEVEVGGKKIIGSAQKRAGSYFIQHGSIPLIKEIELLSAISFGLARLRPDGLTSLSDELGREISFEEAANYFRRGFEEYFQVNLVPFQPSASELEQIRMIETTKYANPAWTWQKLEPPGFDF